MTTPLGAEIDRLRAENKRLTEENQRLRAWLQRIEGGESPCLDQSQLRQWAYLAITLPCAP